MQGNVGLNKRITDVAQRLRFKGLRDKAKEFIIRIITCEHAIKIESIINEYEEMIKDDK